MANRILIVEDERDLAGVLEYNLQREGYVTLAAADGQRALALLRAEPLPDLVLLDVMLPDISGTEICRTIRAQPRTRQIPVLMLTARGDEIDRVVGFEVGADDYVVKPFSLRELLLRIRALLRRATSEDGGADLPEMFGRLRIELASHRVWVDQQEIKLTALEFRLLTTFLQRRGRVQSREQLLGDVWGIHADVMTRTVDTHVKRLREKLGAAGEYVQTLRGVGYRFRQHPDEEPL